jgi:hypothetical protein
MVPEMQGMADINCALHKQVMMMMITIIVMMIMMIYVK